MSFLTFDSSCIKLHILPTDEAPILNTELLVFTGMRFGLMQTKARLVSLLSKYQLSVTKETPIPLLLDPKSLLCRLGLECGCRLERGLSKTLEYKVC